MKSMEEEDAREQAQMRQRIQQLEANLDQLWLSCQQRIKEMEATINEERKIRENAEIEFNIIRNGQIAGTDTVPLPPRRSNRQKDQTEARDTFNGGRVDESSQDPPLGCGKCSDDTRCECIDQAFDMSDIITNNTNSSSKRPHSPSNDEDNKRLRQQEQEDNEMDFTARFSSRKPPSLTKSASAISVPVPTTNPDPCGFCSDGTPCICADMALEAIKSESGPSLSRIPSVNNDTHSEAFKTSNPCINGPGTCDQCLSDANSTLFCKSLAATRRGNQNVNLATAAETVASPPPTPTSSNPFPASGHNSENTQVTPTGPTLSCADAYETLSRHPAFEQAELELSTWMPQLATVPGGQERTAFEVEAASVMGVLKFFDRRFGKKGVKHEQRD